MKTVPPELSSYLLESSLAGRSPAYLVTGRNEVLEKTGGDCTQYGIGSPGTGRSVLEQIPFFHGLLPLKKPTLFLPSVKIEPGRYADVHIIRHGDRHYILFLAVTDEEILHLNLFEKADECTILRDRHERILDQYLGKELAKALDEGQISICETGERRQVSILFVDIRGFTSFSEINPPEVVFAMLNRYLDAMIKPLIEESAVVDKIIGDAVMGVFGILTMAVSPPHQAVMAAMKILAAVQSLNRQLLLEGKPVLEVGIGISSGPVAVGILGSAARKTFSVVGHHVNMAARLQKKAGPQEILVDENTYQEVVTYQQGFSETAIELKGLSGQIRIFSYCMNS